jgi:hypothetical protein
VDVLVIGSPDRDDLDHAAQDAITRLAREVNTTIRTDPIEPSDPGDPRRPGTPTQERATGRLEGVSGARRCGG